MTNEEAKVFLDNLKICIEEHPIVADWLVEIADRKTEPSGYKMKPVEQTEPQYEMGMGTLKCDNCSEYGSFKCAKCDGEMHFKRLEPKTEPQTERSE